MASGTSEWVVEDWGLDVYDLDADDPATVIYTLADTQTTADLVRITGQPPQESDLLTDGFWQDSPDVKGYNCRHTVAWSAYTTAPTVGHRTKHIYKLNTTDWGALYFIHTVVFRSVFATV